MLDSEQPSDAGIGPGEQGIIGVAETTGRFIVVFAEEDGRTDSAGAERILRSLTGVSNIASAQDFTDAAPGDFSQLDAADATLIPDLGVAIVTMDPAAAGGLQAAESSDGRVLDRGAGARAPRPGTHRYRLPQRLPGRGHRPDAPPRGTTGRRGGHRHGRL